MNTQEPIHKNKNKNANHSSTYLNRAESRNEFGLTQMQVTILYLSRCCNLIGLEVKMYRLSQSGHRILTICHLYLYPVLLSSVLSSGLKMVYGKFCF